MKYTLTGGRAEFKHSGPIDTVGEVISVSGVPESHQHVHDGGRGRGVGDYLVS